MLLCCFVVLALSGCVTNPVTGKSDFNLVSENQELAIGAQQYAPARQAQGGDYVVDRELTDYVSRIGNRLAAVSDRKLPYEFHVLNNSVPNAWALPGGKISINRGLLTELNSEAELAAVLAHEIVHAAARHGAKGMSRGMLVQAAAMGAVVAAQGSAYAGIAQIGAGIGSQLITQKYGRDAERESDHYGMIYMARAGYDPQGAVNLQRTFVKLSEGNRQDWVNGLFASHPPSEERVQNNIAFMATLPKGGEIGRERYRQKMAHLKQTVNAYQSFEKGKEALAKGDLAKAGRLAAAAIAVEPREGHFSALMGDVEQKRHYFNAAAQRYDRAIALNPDFFYYYLQRGRNNTELHRDNAARADLEQSARLLPTADAYVGLGLLARRGGRLEEAKSYYAKVAGSQGPMAKGAYGELVDLDLNDHPEKYIQIRLGSDRQGRVVAQINNPTPRPVGQLVLAFQYQAANGQLQQFNRGVNDRIAAGSNVVIDTELTGRLTPEQLSTLKVIVRAARIVR